MMSDFLGSIGGLEFVTADVAFTEAAEAQRNGNFGRPEGEELVIQPPLSAPNDAPAPESDASAASSSAL